MDRHHRLVESSPDGIVVVVDDQIGYANPAAVRLFGFAGSGGLPGRLLLDRFHEESRARVERQLQRWQAGGEVPPVDATIVAADGQLRDVSVAGAHLPEESGPAVQIVVRDITERKALERALRESEERLALAVAGGEEGVWDWDLETNAVTYSARWKQMLGYADDEIEPHVSAWERLVHPDDRSAAARAHDSVARGDRPTYEAEFRLRHKDGHYVPVLSRGFPVRSPADRRVIRIVGTHLDLTERKRAEATLRESEERLKLAFAGAQEGIWDWNLQTGAVVYSSRWKEMLGYDDNEIEPHVSAWERLVHPDDRSAADRAHDSVARGARTTYEAEFRLRHKDGHYVHVLSRGYPVRLEPGGPVVRIVGTHFDLTARKQAEAERARTELLSRLVFAQEDERRRISREMHDQFGEQLTALAQQIRALKDAGSSDGKWQAHVESLERIAERLDRDVDHLVWELRPTALDDLGLRAALANYIQSWSGRVGINATLHSAGLLNDRLSSHVETALYRIAQEALTNVAKHARAGNVDVILERRDDHVLLIIEDDGVGFDAAAAEASGRGLGLVGMKERAGLVGATLEIESSPGSGTTLFVRTDAGTATEAADYV